MATSSNFGKLQLSIDNITKILFHLFFAILFDFNLLFLFYFSMIFKSNLYRMYIYLHFSFYSPYSYIFSLYFIGTSGIKKSGNLIGNILRMKISQNSDFDEKSILSNSIIFDKKINKNNKIHNNSQINVNKNLLKINDNLSNCRSQSSDNCSSLTSLKSGQIIGKNPEFPISTFFDPKRIIIKPGQRIKVRAKGKRK